MDNNRYVIFKCFNPFEKPNHKIKDKKKLRTLTNWMFDRFPQVPKESKICDSCRKQLGTFKAQENSNQPSASEFLNQEISSSESETDTNFSSKSEVVDKLNASLHELGESPLDSKKVNSKYYASTKIKKISSAMKRKLFTHVQESSEDETESAGDSVLNNLKINFSNTDSRAKK